MKASISWWDLSDSDQTIDSLREYLRSEAVAAWRGVPGLRFKCWIADPAGNRWGAFMLWDVDDIDPAVLPPHRAQELIGYPPQQRVRFDVEAGIGLEALGVVDA